MLSWFWVTLTLIAYSLLWNASGKTIPVVGQLWQTKALLLTDAFTWYSINFWQVFVDGIIQANDVDRAEIWLIRVSDHCRLHAAQYWPLADQLQRQRPAADQSQRAMLLRHQWWGWSWRSRHRSFLLRLLDLHNHATTCTLCLQKSNF